MEMSVSKNVYDFRRAMDDADLCGETGLRLITFYS